ERRPTLDCGSHHGSRSDLEVSESVLHLNARLDAETQGRERVARLLRHGQLKRARIEAVAGCCPSERTEQHTDRNCVTTPRTDRAGTVHGTPPVVARVEEGDGNAG